MANFNLSPSFHFSYIYPLLAVSLKNTYMYFGKKLTWNFVKSTHCRTLKLLTHGHTYLEDYYFCKFINRLLNSILVSLKPSLLWGFVSAQGSVKTMLTDLYRVYYRYESWNWTQKSSRLRVITQLSLVCVCALCILVVRLPTWLVL